MPPEIQSWPQPPIRSSSSASPIEPVVAGHAVDEVVAGLAVDLVGSADVGRQAGRRVIGPAPGVVERRDRADDDAAGRRRRPVAVVVERQEATGVRRAARADQTVDVAVVADDRIGVACVDVRDDGAVARPAHVVAVELGAGAAEDHVRAVGTLRDLGERVEARGAADHVVLTEAAEDDVVAAAALDVVVAVGRRLERRADDEVEHDAAGDHAPSVDAVARRLTGPGRQRAGRQVGGDAVHAGRGVAEVDRAVALDHVVAELAEEHVVGRAAREVVAAVAGRAVDGVRRRRVEQVEQLEPEPPGRRRAVGVAVRERSAQRRHAARAVRAGQHVDRRAQQRAEARVQDRAVALEGHGVAEHQVVVGAAVDGVAARAADQHVVARPAPGHVACRRRACRRSWRARPAARRRATSCRPGRRGRGR